MLVWLGLWAHLRWRLDGWRAGRWSAPALAALGLAAGETGLAALAYLVAWEICERRPGWRRALSPTALLIAAYFIVYRLAGWGAHGSGTYLDPFGDPGGFLRELPARLAILFGNLVLATPIDAVTFDARLRAPLIAAGCGAAVATMRHLLLGGRSMARSARETIGLGASEPRPAGPLYVARDLATGPSEAPPMKSCSAASCRPRLGRAPQFLAQQRRSTSFL